ncbi:MAG: DUF1080 domain-containing protein [Chitinophagaceae bacterium]|nr:MAG: DUF1080 domain-containing protein [Chitinophagaceae bacterium]
MKKYLYLLAFSVAITLQTNAQKQNIEQALDAFPYQQVSDIQSTLQSMENWKKSDWKKVFILLQDDSLKLKPTYAIAAYTHKASLNSVLYKKWWAIISQQFKKKNTPYAATFLKSQMNLLSSEETVHTLLSQLSPRKENVAEALKPMNHAMQLLALQDQMQAVIENNGNHIEKKRILNNASRIPTLGAFMFIGKFLQDEAIQKDAALMVTRLAINNESIKGPIVREVLEKAVPFIKGEDSAILVNKLKAHLLKMPYDYGFVNLFNGKDLTGWKGLVSNPIALSKMSDSALQVAQQKANESIQKDWIVKDGLLIFTGHGDNLATEKKYGDIEMYVDWKITEKGDAGIYLRGSPQVQIWDTSRREVGAQVGSGGLYNNTKYPSKPLLVADNKIGEWNTFHIIMKGEKVTVYLNGMLVTDNVILENYWDRKIPIFTKEQIELQAHGTYVAYRNIYLRELPSEDPALLSEVEQKDGFVSLFDGTNMDQWQGNIAGYLLKDGAIEVNPQAKGGGNLYTKEEYDNFIYRFDFQLTPGGNNGIGLHAPLEGDAAYVGMEIQVLDNEADIYKNLFPYQYHGSVYGIMPAKRGFLKPIGEWNQEEIFLSGTKIKVTLNGTVINEGDIKDAIKNGTMDHKEHPGLARTTGHIGFLGHGDVIRFKNMRIKKLPEPKIIEAKK